MAVAFPGGTSISALRVYTSAAPDGVIGGSPHVHVVSTEAYVVVGGSGELHTLDASGYRERPIAAGDVVWFSPGVIHRAVSHGDLEVRVVMQNAGLPEAGDAIMTFPDEILADAEAYRAAAALPTGADAGAAALARRDLAVRGFVVLRDAVLAGDPDALTRFYDRVTSLVAPRAAEWRATWDASVAEVTRATDIQLDDLAAGRAPQLAGGRVATADPIDAFGMCGRLTRFDTLHPRGAAHETTGPSGPERI
ncbi:cupin domain-containing protein [Agromyces atrinae]|uniref:Cupin domain-containing protein n=1 Tax=Agromyces atrinae TaxID=592376 RepID=A0A4Q2M5S9_9MICO|nr:cupin domain-containing protein [Agromyces atrinae]NYD67043.1 mannose-6-phosphate isomerase-like protein (cupin superfamily) [Agromyces atrinae]RXZ85231.1 cupin domain-containing protein [Agromyces atrinae]RXZ85339.1 cupin domain-containing protein [Agromyces atrinae]